MLFDVLRVRPDIDMHSRGQRNRGVPRRRTERRPGCRFGRIRHRVCLMPSKGRFEGAVIIRRISIPEVPFVHGSVGAYVVPPDERIRNPQTYSLYLQACPPKPDCLARASHAHRIRLPRRSRRRTLTEQDTGLVVDARDHLSRAHESWR